MPVELDLSALPDALPPLNADEQHLRDERELVSLRATVVELLEQIRRGAGHAVAPALPLVLFPALPLALSPVPVAAAKEAEFIAMLAHELRNPMQPIVLAAAMLAKVAGASPVTARAHAVLERQVGHLRQLIDSLLEGGRAASGKMKIDRRPVSLAEILAAAVETAQSGFDQRCQNVQLFLPNETVMLSGDLLRLAQAFGNLLINASQFTPARGNISVTATTSAHAVQVCIVDDGAGIDAALQPAIFDLFVQGHRTLDRSPSGLGLGLYLARTIVGLHDGCVGVASAGAGKGSTLTVSLPLAAATGMPAPIPVVREAGSVAPVCRILVIEDDVDANEIMAILLGMGGHEVTSRFDGNSGLRAALDADVDIVLCDLALPGLNGFEVIAGIKSARGEQAPLVIATTGYSNAAQLDLARAAGFDHYLVKPLDVDALLKIITEFVGNR